MNYYTIIYEEIPKCKTCGREMNSWIVLANEHEHDKCSSQRISDSLIREIKLKFNHK